MNLIPPFPLSAIVQRFGQNAVSYYVSDGLKGHPGIDFGASWGTPIHAATTAECSVTAEPTDPSFYRAVYQIYDDTDGNSYEITYGHCSAIFAKAGTTYLQGDAVANVGNSGLVYQGNRLVTREEKLAGSHAGEHLHFQVRLLKKVSASQVGTGSAHYVNNGSSNLILNGYAYEVPFWDNGYNGCVDPMQFFDDSAEVVRAEISVLNKSKDKSVIKALSDLVATQVKKMLGIG